MKVILRRRSFPVAWDESRLRQKGNLIEGRGGEDAALTAGGTPALPFRDAGATVAGCWRWDLGAIESSKMTVF